METSEFVDRMEEEMRRIALLLGTVGIIAMGLAGAPSPAQAQGWRGYPSGHEQVGANTNGANGRGANTNGASIIRAITAPMRPIARAITTPRRLSSMRRLSLPRHRLIL